MSVQAVSQVPNLSELKTDKRADTERIERRTEDNARADAQADKVHAEQNSTHRGHTVDTKA